MSPGFSPIALRTPVAYVGRLAVNDIVLNSTNVSRRHAKFIVTDMGVTVHDLDSHNGIFLNGKKVRSSPVAVGDRVYIGDICIELQQPDVAFSPTPTSITRTERTGISDEDDPAARNLAALSRAIELTQTGDDDTWAIELLEVCRDLVEASLVALVEFGADGTATPTLTLPPGSRGAATIRAIATSAAHGGDDLLVADLAADPRFQLVDGEPQAWMAVRVLARDALRLVIVVARPQAAELFGAREFATLRTIASLVGARVLQDEAPTASAAAPQLSASEIAAQTSAALESMQQQLSREHAQVLAVVEERARGAETQARAAEAQVGTVRAHVAELEAELRRARTDLELLQGAQNGAEGERSALTAEVDGHRARIAELEGALAGARGDAERAHSDVDAARAELAQLRAEHDRTRTALDAQVTALQASRDELQGRLDAAHANGSAGESLRQAMRTSLLPTLAAHVEAIASGSSVSTPPQAREVCAVHIALAGFDAWCHAASADDVRVRLDRFCEAVVTSAAAHGGRVEQVAGHAHLVTFNADAQGVQAAALCALDVVENVRRDVDADVLAGIDVGTVVAGFFGAETVSYVEAGPAVLRARGMADFAPGPSGVLVSDVARAQLTHDAALEATNLGPCFVRGAPAPIKLFVVEKSGGAR